MVWLKTLMQERMVQRVSNYCMFILIEDAAKRFPELNNIVDFEGFFLPESIAKVFWSHEVVRKLL